MGKVDKNQIIDDTTDFFDQYFENMELDSDIEKLYDLIDDGKLKLEYENNSKLNKLRYDNHRRYHNIKVSKLKSLPYDLDGVVSEILELYKFVDYKNILSHNLDEARNTKVLLDKIYKKMHKLARTAKSTCEDLAKKNDEMQAKFSIDYFNNLKIKDDLKMELLERYNKLLMYNPGIEKDLYENLKIQIITNEYIKNIIKKLPFEEKIKINMSDEDRLKQLNKKINIKIQFYKDKIKYLEDLIIKDSKYIKDFENFKNFFNRTIAYDDSDYNTLEEIYELLCDKTKLEMSINKYEELFIEEIENKKKEEQFVYEKFGVKNIRKSLDYIFANYIDILDDESKKVIEHINNKVNEGNYDISQVYKALSFIVKDIWKNTITDIYSYNPKDDYYFMCSNNPFIDDKYQAILISKKEIDRVNNYFDYQIGFICSYNDNILYITENDDITTVNYDDLSSLKTPIQVEQEFMNFRVCNRIALNGYQTKLQAVYIINDGNKDMYDKALELANTYSLPLIELKKDN